MPITPDFDLGLVDTFEGAPAGQLLSARPNWEVGRADNSGAGAAAAWKINGGRVRVYEDYEAPIVARYGPAAVVNRLRWTWEIPAEGFSSIGYDRCGVVMWWNAGSFLQIRFQPQNNRIIVAGGGFNNFYQVNQHGADGGPLFVQLPSSNWVSTTPIVLVEASLDGAGALQIYVNGVYVQAYAGNGSPLPAIDVSAYTGPKSGKVGLYADTSEAFTNGKPMANEFAIPGLTCTRPAVPPALPRSPSGPRRITRTMTAAGGTPQAGIHRIVSAETGEVVRDWDVGIASSVSGQEVTQSVDVPVGRSDDEAWDIEWGVVFTSGKAAKALSPTRTACGFSFCVGGQSNAGGMQTAARPGGAPAILNQAYALWNAGDDTWRYRGIDAPGAMNFINDIASEVAKLLNMPVMGWAWGAYAASLTAQLPGAGGWDGPAPSGIAFEDMKARANGYTPEMLVVFQGENEAAGADGDAGADNWPTHLNTLRNAFRAEGEFPEAPVVIGVTGKYANDTPPIGSPAACRRYWNRLQAAQKTVGSAALKTTVGWESLGVPRDPSDAYHYNYAAYSQLLKRIAWAIVRAAGGSAPDGRGPLPTSATVSGSDLIIEHSLNGATSMSGSALTGYETSPDTSGETFSAVSASDAAVIPGTTRVRLTGHGSAKRWRSYYGYNPDDTSMARGAYSGGDTIPAQAQTTPMAVTSGSTPTPTPVPTPTPTPPATPTPTPTPGATPRGTVTALPDWMARFTPTPDASPRPGGAPNGSVSIRAKMDPHTRRNIGFDFSALLGPDGEIANITKVLVGATAGLDGFRVATDPAVFLSVDGRQGQLRAYILPARQDDGIFNSTGTVVPITIKGEQTDGQDVEATLLVTVVNL